MIYRTAAFAALLLCLSASQANASLVTITQSFGAAQSNLIVNGSSQSVSGDWIFKVVTDTTNPDLDPNAFIGRWEASVTVSNTGLGLVDVAVNSHWYYYELNGNRSGITNADFDSGTILIGPNNSVGNSNLIDSLDFNATVQSSFFFESTTELELANGTRIQGIVTMDGGFQSSSSSTIPEPSSMVVFSLLGIGGFGFARRRKAKE